MIDRKKLVKKLKNYLLSRTENRVFNTYLEMLPSIEKGWEKRRDDELFPLCLTTKEAFNYLVIALNRKAYASQIPTLSCVCLARQAQDSQSYWR
jgi:hypothetical protein